MKPASKFMAVVVAVCLAPAFGRANDPLPPPNATWAGTTDIDNLPNNPRKRVGIVAYCADLYHNAGDTGVQADKRSIKNGPWLLDGPFNNLGQYGAQNLADYLAYDDGIDRVRDLSVIDGDLALPTGSQLIQNFDIVIAYTDNKCGQPIPTSIANSAASALAAFVAAPGKKLILTGFAFSNSIGFGNGIFGAGLSPLRKGGPGLAACSRGAPCHVGVCPAGCLPVGTPPECFVNGDPAQGFCAPHYEPSTATTLGTNNADNACGELLNNVSGPTSSSWATNLTAAQVVPGATLCFDYNGTTVPFIAINQARTVYAVNAFPPDATDIQKFWFGCMLGNIVQYLSGDTHRCLDRGLTYPFCQP